MHDVYMYEHTESLMYVIYKYIQCITSYHSCIAYINDLIISAKCIGIIIRAHSRMSNCIFFRAYFSPQSSLPKGITDSSMDLCTGPTKLYTMYRYIRLHECT